MPLRSAAESLARLKASLISYIIIVYKIRAKVKSKFPMRICSLPAERLKHYWNQMLWPVKNLGCGTADCYSNFAASRSIISILVSPMNVRASRPLRS